MINASGTRNASYKKTPKKRSISDISGTRVDVQNRGGLLGGLGYLGGSLLAGIGGVGEGIADLFTAAGAAIGGDFEYAKYVFKDNNVGEWHESITESYNPGNVMKFFGDVTHGIGQSSVFLLNAIPGLGQLGTAAFFAGTASQGISGAAAKTGDVGFGEVAYGVLSGGVEAGLEALGGGMGKVAKNIGSPLLKNIGITATRKGLLGSVLTDAASEFGEEFASELIDPWLLNWTQVDPDARMSLGDAVYAGFVGLVSGTVSAGVSDVAKFAGNRKNGAKIMQSGNADTLINTANYVADKLIGQGADFKKAPEWAQHLRMQVNAYNDLVNKGKATGATAETILGEIQASLYFAETQSTHERIKAGIMAKSEADRAALAEYVNQTVEKSKRKKDYTAADVAADTDGIASQLATMSFVRGGFDIDGAIKDLQQEGGIEDVINSERAQAAKRAEAEKKKAQGAETDAAFEAAVARGENNVPNNVPAQGAVDGGVPIAGETAFVQNDEVVAPNRAAPVENIYEEGAESLPYGGVPEARVGTYPSIEELDVEGREIKYDLTEDGREVLPDSGKPEPPGSAYPSVQKQELENMTVTEADRAAARERTERAANFEREQSEAYNRGNVSESREKATEGKNEAQGAEEIKINEPKEALTDEQRAERADKAAKAKAQEWVEWDKKTAPTMRELNRARELVKEFDDLEIPRRLAILRTIRSAEGVDAVTLKGVVNIMAVLPKSDLEIRFAEGIGQKGLYTTVGGKKLIVLNSDTNFKSTIKGTIAHELVHYLEKRAGYKQFAEFVRKNAKPEAIERHKQRYIDGWAAIGYKYTESELEEEITASLVADALQSERFLKRYADRDKKLIQRAASWLGGLVKGLKRKGEETREERKIAEAYGTWMSALLQMPEVGESRSGVKYDLDEKLGEQLKEWLDNGGKKGTKYNGVYFDLGTTPNVFIKHGAKNVKMIMYDDVVAKVTGMKGDTAHTISIDEIAKLPSQLNDPILLFKGSVPGSFVALTELTDKYGNDVVVAVHINRKNERSTITKIASLYSKTNEYGKNKIESFVNKQIESNNLIDASAKKAPTWFTTRGLQLPKVVQTIIDANNSIPQKNDLSTPSVKKYDLADGDAAYMAAVESGDMETAQRMVDEAAKEAGYVTVSRYHQTGVKFNEFSNEHPDAGLNDSDTPNGYFFKENDHDIGVGADFVKTGHGGNIQMRVYLKHKNMLYFKNRDEAREWYAINIPGYQELLEKYDQHLRDFETANSENNKKMFDELIALEESGQSTTAKDLEIMEKYDKIMDKWIEDRQEYETGLRFRMRKLLNEYFIENDSGYDGIELADDGHRYIDMKREDVHTFIVFKNTQIKSADPVTYDDNRNIIPLSKRFNPQKSDIRYDLADDGKKTAKEEKKDKKDAAFERAVGQMYKKEAQEANKRATEAVNKAARAEKTAKAFAAQAARSTEKYKLVKGENKRLKTSNLQLAKLLAREAKQEEAKTYTQKEHSELIARMQTYASDKFSAIADSKDATISKYDKERFAEDLYIALSLAGNDLNYRERVHAIAGQFSKRFLEGIYFPEEGGKRVYLKELIDDDTYKRYAKTFENKLIKSFEKMGKQTSYAAIISRYNAEMERFKQKLLDSEQKGKKFRELIYQAQKLRTEISIQKRDPQDEGIIAVEREMGKITNERGQMSAKQADAAFALFNQFLLGEGEKVEGALTSFAHDEGAEILDMLQEYLHSREGRIGKPLTAREMDLAATIIAGGRKLLREYNKVFVNGHWVDIDKFAGDTVGDLLDLIEGKKEYSNKVSEWLGGKLKGFGQWYFYNILSPETVIESLEGYKKNGAMKTLYRSIRDARQKADHRAVQMKKPFAEYLDDKENAWEDEKGHKHSYRSKLNKKIINVNGYEITLGEAIYLYMLTKREEAHAGLRESGYITYDENNQEKKRFKILEIEETANFIYNQFDKADIKFLEMAEQFFNKTSTKVKTDADMEIFGYTNTIDSYYVPMIRDRYSRMQGVTDARQGIESIITVYNKSFNQNVVYNAKALEGKNIMEIINDHADGLAEYAEMYLPLKAFDRVYNRAVVLEDGSKTTIRSILNNKVWQKSEKYFKKLFEDIQGQGRKSNSEMLDPLVGKLRSGWVNAVLGANIKVVLTQTSSLGAATQVIEPKYIMKALSVMIPMKNVSEIGERADKYSKIIEARSFDMGALKAQGNIDKINDIGRKTGIFIEKTDRRVCLAIFHAAELRVEETMGLAVGTEENAIEAAKIADEAIYTTQAMSSASERSALQRSTSEIAKVFAMFTSDTVKNLSHLYGNTMKYFAHRERVKAGDVSYEAELKKDAREIRKSVRTLAITGVMIGAITQLFKYLYAKEEEEPEDRAWDAVGDVVSSTLNIFPIISDVVDKWVMGYDLSLNVFDLANDTFDSVKTTFNLAGKAMSGQYVSGEDVAKATKNLVNSVTTVFGFPAAPIERTVTGLMRRFTPSTIYGYDALFSNPSYTADLKKAVESGDERLAEHILATLYNNEITGVYSSEELEEIARLYSITDDEGKHLSVLPQRIGDTVNDVKLDAKQRKQFAAIYSEASASVNRLIDSPYYDALDDAQKAKAIKNTYSLYYNRAASEVVGKEWTNAQAYSLLTANIPALFASQAYKSGLEVQKDKRGKEISVKDQFVEYAANLGLSETDLTVISYANSVRGKDMKEKLIEHINSMSLDEETKAKIAERLGFVIKSGKVAEKED